jgi:hypothetical protein
LQPGPRPAKASQPITTPASATAADPFAQIRRMVKP